MSLPARQKSEWSVFDKLFAPNNQPACPNGVFFGQKRGLVNNFLMQSGLNVHVLFMPPGVFLIFSQTQTSR